jgi:hypothetical protein
MRMTYAAMVAGFLVGLMSGAVQAAPITQSYDFSFGFDHGPLSDITGSFTATYDLGAGTGILDKFSSNLPSQYLPAEFAISGNQIVVGDNCSTSECDVDHPGANQFFFFFLVDNKGSNPTDPFAVYSSSSQDDFSFATTASVTLSSVPLPASAPMFGAALVALGAVGYGVKRKKAAAA